MSSLGELARSVGNQRMARMATPAAPVLARFTEVNFGAWATGGAGATPAFHAQAYQPQLQVDATDAARPKYTHTRTAEAQSATPDLKVAEDQSLAVSAAAQPKELYATAAVEAAANADLETSGSPLKLQPTGRTLTPPAGGAALNMLEPVPNSGTIDRDAAGYAKLAANECDQFANHVMGDLGSLRFTGTDGVSHFAGLTKDNASIGGASHVAEAMTNGPLDAAGAQQAADANQQSAPQITGQAYGHKQLQEDAAAGQLTSNARDMGVNQFARAGVGEGYVTASMRANTNELIDTVDHSEAGTPARAFRWGYHFAPVIAESLDKQDHVMLENYNHKALESGKLRQQVIADAKAKLAAAGARTKSDHKATGGASSQAGELIRRLRGEADQIGADAEARSRSEYTRLFADNNTKSMWYFRIVGPQTKGQSFHDMMRESGDFANPLTMVVSSSSVGRVFTLKFDEGKTTMRDQDTVVAANQARDMAKIVLRAEAHGSNEHGDGSATSSAQPRALRVKITGYATGAGRRRAAARLATANTNARRRAEALADQLKAHGIRDDQIDFQAPQIGFTPGNKPESRKAVAEITDRGLPRRPFAAHVGRGRR